MARFTLFIQVIVAVMTSCLVCGSLKEPPLPEVDLHEWWGPESMKYRHDDSIRPFRINFNESMINDLRYRLRYHRPFPPPLEGVAFQYGFNSNQLERWVRYWADQYPFLERQQFLNQFPQYKINIQGLDIHFIRVGEKNTAHKEVVPLLLLHGWPGSVREFYETIPYMLEGSKDKDYELEIIVPSLPGFGFSDAAARPSLGVDKVAVVFRNFMHRLGHKRYYIQGGDMGAIVANNMATFFPKEVLGLHMNFVFTHTMKTMFLIALGSLYPPAIARSEVLDRLYPLSKRLSGLLEESGYLHLQATKPDTVGVGVSDSPAGLAAYVLEKFATGTRREHLSYPDGGLTSFYTADQLIDNLMMYWTSNSMTTAMRLYAETFNKRYFGLRINEIKSPVPTWVIQARNEIFYVPPWMIRMKFPHLLNETVLSDGGHFLAFEKPRVFAENVLHTIDAFRHWHGIRQHMRVKRRQG